jgi:Flp pilus assembly pilin Flp
MRQIAQRLRAAIDDESGATMVEYAMMVVLIAAVCFGIVAAIGATVPAEFTNTSAGI